VNTAESEDRPIRIERIGSFIPETTASVQELSGPLGLGTNHVLLFTRYLGLKQIAVAGDLELGDMLAAAGEDALGESDRDAVRFLIHTHTMQHVAPPSRHTLETVRTKLGLKNATVFGMSHVNCVAGLYALDIARYLLHTAHPEDKVLILMGDKILSPRLRVIPETTILGEAAAGCLVGRDPRGDRVLGRAVNVVGRFYQCLGGCAELLAEYKKVYTEELGRVMLEAVKDAGCTPGQIAAVLPHNVNRLSWKRVCGSLGIPPERIYLENIPKFGHCYGADPFINLKTARQSGRIVAGDRVLLTSAGLGAAFAASVVRLGPGTAADRGGRTEAAR
jgi:3-oxoacyl-[acyl-carrier-protein] synthase III